MLFSTLCETYSKVAATSKRLEKTLHVSRLLEETPDESLEPVLLLLQGRVFPQWDRTTIGISQKLAIKAIATATGIAQKQVVARFKELGDLGEVTAELSKRKQQETLFSRKLEVKDVFSTIQKIAFIEGQRSVDRKLKHIAQLLTSASENEARFVIRIVLEDLRIGIAEGTLRDSIVWAAVQRHTPLKYDPDKNEWSGPAGIVTEWTLAVQQAIDRTSDLPRVARAARMGLEELRRIEIEPGTPLRVMLAQRSTDIHDAFARVGMPAAVEYKYDGFRMQIHRTGSDILLFTRRLEDVTKQFPDIVQAVKRHISHNCILDAEIVGYNPSSGKHMPFQEISQRIRRKYEITRLAKKLPVEVNVFDILMLDGETTYERPFEDRRKLVEKIVPEEKRVIRPSTMLITRSEKKVQEFYRESLEKGYEGLMFKSLQAEYKPGSRVGYMVKLKPTLDTLDLVIVKAEWGTGKRSGWLTSFTLACRNENDDLVEIGKVGTGFKELENEESVTFKTMTQLLKEDILEERGREASVRPIVVLEIRFEEIQKSPSYSSGYALRFPRVVRVRSDRRKEDISSLEDVEDLYRAQRGRS